jgi:hypothetical protein
MKQSKKNKTGNLRVRDLKPKKDPKGSDKTSSPQPPPPGGGWDTRGSTKY